MKTAKQTIQDVLRRARMIGRLAENGIEIKFHRHLDRMSNVQWNRGQLYDAMCHYTNRTEVVGNTYPVRDILKSAGFRWDAARKVWWVPANQSLSAVIPQVCRRLSERHPSGCRVRRAVDAGCVVADAPTHFEPVPELR